MRLRIMNILVSSLLLTVAGVEACQCRQGSRQGQYCGHCSQVLPTADFIYNHVYECNPSGGCRDYGYRRDCDSDHSSDRPVMLWLVVKDDGPWPSGQWLQNAAENLND
ncbi:hypothetical protein PAAG_11356 [Paracoccidioides lutzii Pb01]|uniref:Uncharacterized protein n=1 Tax=Paracoccidioides lutzii (strain ATCC MYA-826 / Pb01) TaxID=502779 RepID=A0A0A2V2C9_PARBA|nr:hypothetical protein PAAG_11356 [Paracoccidioides lutzii Pb01]KGQ01961.1 hypothetical protein PAAG_11356 [Paracoccidioides lutzii Pb01]